MNDNGRTSGARTGVRTGSHAIDLVLVVIALLVVAVPAWIATHVDMPPIAAARAAQQRPVVVPPTVLPAVEPIEYRAIAVEDARAINAAIPFVGGPNPAARAFRFAGGAEDRARATECLAAAVLYEAGDDPVGQRAVAQVVLNRVRHPAFPSTVCGVVFQGSERRTGCQFTFTCDGALARTYPEPFWQRARAVATAALGGRVHAPVGYATHYHTDWVVPYWSSSLDKVAAVDTHLFFRWTGWWGTAGAFRQRSSGAEPRIVQLAARSEVHKLPEVLAAEAEAQALLGGDIVSVAQSAIRSPADDPNSFVATLGTEVAPADYAALALKTCGDRPRCKFLGWTDARVVQAIAPEAVFDNAGALATMTFSYLRDRDSGLERALWNCSQVERPEAQCMRRNALATAARRAASPRPDAVAATPVLPGVRRRTDLPRPPALPDDKASGAPATAAETR